MNTHFEMDEFLLELLRSRSPTGVEREGIHYQVGAESRPTGTDARVLQTTRGGVATGLIGIPLRYMHTPAEVADLADIADCVKLLEAFALSLKNTDDFTF